MSPLFNMIEDIALEQILKKAAPASQGIKTTGVFLGTCLFLFMSGSIALFVALFLYLSTLIVPHYAALATAAILMVLSSFCYFVWIAYRKHKKAIQQRQQKEIEDLVALFATNLKKDISQTTIDNPEISMITSAMAGLIFGRILS